MEEMEKSSLVVLLPDNPPCVKQLQEGTAHVVYVCDMCHAVFAQRHMLVTHKRTHVSSRESHNATCPVHGFGAASAEEITKNGKKLDHNERDFAENTKKTSSSEEQRDVKMPCILPREPISEQCSVVTPQRPTVVYYESESGENFTCTMEIKQEANDAENCDDANNEVDTKTAEVKSMESESKKKSKKSKASYQCSHCAETFGNKKILRKHVKTHNGANEKNSSKSPEKVRAGVKSSPGKENNSEMDATQKNTAKAKVFQCDKCDKGFTDKNKLKRHEKTHMERKLYECPHCRKMFSLGGKEPMHKTPTQCSHCKESIPDDIVDFKTKIFRLKEQESYSCPVCSKSFSKKYDIITHAWRHSDIKPHKCSVCEMSFVTNHKLLQHVRIHTGDKPYKCKYCDRCFPHKVGLDCHTRTHTGEKPYMCSVCGHSFVDKSSLNYHMASHNEDKPHKCPECGQGFKAQFDVKRHMRIHTGEKPYVCADCGKAFRLSKLLQNHRVVHTGKRNHVCDVCDKTFTQRSALNKHMRIHTGEKPHQCNQCGKKFVQRPHLQKHMKFSCPFTKQKGSELLKCNVCGDLFTEQGKLEEHQMTHMNDKKVPKDSNGSNGKLLQCALCGKTFMTISSLNLHLMVHKESVQQPKTFYATQSQQFMETGSGVACEKERSEMSDETDHHRNEPIAYNVQTPKSKELTQVQVDNGQSVHNAQFSETQRKVKNLQTGIRIPSDSLLHAEPTTDEINKANAPSTAEMCSKPAIRNNRASTGDRPLPGNGEESDFDNNEAMYSSNSPSCDGNLDHLIFADDLDTNDAYDSDGTIDIDISVLSEDLNTEQCQEKDIVEKLSERRLEDKWKPAQPMSMGKNSVSNATASATIKDSCKIDGTATSAKIRCSPGTSGNADSLTEAVGATGDTENTGVNRPQKRIRIENCKYDEVIAADRKEGDFDSDATVDLDLSDWNRNEDRSVLVNSPKTEHKQTKCLTDKRKRNKENPKGRSNSVSKVRDLGLYLCLYCKKIFSTLQGSESTGERSEGQGHCPYCSEDTEDVVDFRTHLRLLKKTDSYQCAVCDKGYAKRSDLLRHVWRHCEEKPLKCNQCEKSFVDKYKLEVHFRTHSGEKPYQCSHCGKTFSQKLGFDSHMRTHTGEKPYQCNECGRSFGDKSNLRYHIMTHAEVNKYQCTECGKGFKTQFKLKEHMRIHTGEKPYVCADCGKAFRITEGLQIHRVIHTGKRNHVCTICGKTFTQKSALTKHMLIHTGEKPHQCTQCGKKFVQKPHLQKHMKFSCPGKL